MVPNSHTYTVQRSIPLILIDVDALPFKYE